MPSERPFLFFDDPDQQGDMSLDPWHPDQIAVPLGTVPIPRLDSAFGQGHRYPVGQSETLSGELDVYPQAGIVHYASEDFTLTLRSPHPPQPHGDHVTFRRQTAESEQSFSVSESGEVIFLSKRQPL